MSFLTSRPGLRQRPSTSSRPGRAPRRALLQRGIRAGSAARPRQRRSAGNLVRAPSPFRGFVAFACFGVLVFVSLAFGEYGRAGRGKKTFSPSQDAPDIFERAEERESEQHLQGYLMHLRRSPPTPRC